MRCKFHQIVARRIGQGKGRTRLLLFLPEYRFDAEFALLLDQTALSPNFRLTALNVLSTFDLKW